jgi:hypothetical protein
MLITIGILCIIGLAILLNLLPTRPECYTRKVNKAFEGTCSGYPPKTLTGTKQKSCHGCAALKEKG